MKAKRLIITIIIAAGIFVLLQMYDKKNNQPSEDQAATQPASQPATAPASQPTSATAEASADDVKAAPAAAKPAWRIKPGQTPGCSLGSLTRDKDGDPQKEYLFQVNLRSEGAAIESVHLTDYFQTVDDKRLFDKLDKDEARYAEEIAKNPDTYKGHYALLAPVIFKDHAYYSLATQTLVLSTGKKADDADTWTFTELRSRRWELVSTHEDELSQSAVFEWRIYRAEDLTSPAITLRKTYIVTRGSYSIGVTFECINHTNERLRMEFDQAGPVGVTKEDPRMDQRMAVVGRLENNDQIQRQDFSVTELGKSAYGQPIVLGRSDAQENPVVWLAYVNKFFGSILYLEPSNAGTLNAAATNAQFYITPVQQDDKERMWETGVQIGGIDLSPAGDSNAAKTFTYNLFAGPKVRQMFRDDPLYSRLSYNETMSTSGSCAFCTFNWLMDALMWLLSFFAKFLFGNFGLAIILLVVIVRVLLHPLMKYSQVSMAKMQKSMASLKPQMEKIREKYANDKATQQRELLRLQKEAGVGPGQMLGCLPMVLQMPIWIALYTGLNSEVALRHAAFLPVWITDLAAPDHLFRFGTSLPLVGDYFNLLPLLLTVAMFLSMKMSPTTIAQASSPEQKQQQMMMKLMMPVMMLFFFYHAPSGLTLYIMASTFAGVAESYYIRKHIKDREEMDAASETIVSFSGKGPRDTRPKKPKGPFWTKRG